MYDILIIGAGVSGCACARELSRYKANICVLEKEEDVCSGTSKANSAIVHAGFDARTNSLMAKLNVEGHKMMPKLCEDLEIPYEANGSLVVCTDKESLPNLQELYNRGIANGVSDIRIIDRDEIVSLEPNISDNVISALYAPKAGIICPFTLNIAMAENAYANGVEFKFNTEVFNIKKENNIFKVETNNGTLESKYIINASGLYADKFNNMVSNKKINITARRGEYLLLDNETYHFVKNTIFDLPGKFGKGVLIAPTIHGNIIVGPTALNIDDKEATNTTSEGLEQVFEKSKLTVKNIPYDKVITSFSGLRAHEDNHEFIIGEVEDCENFFNCAGIESPGLTSSPAIGVMISELISKKGNLEKKDNFIEKRKGIVHFQTLSIEEKNKIIKENSAYGNIICRCEQVTEGQVLEAIRRPLGAKSLDGLKRRVRATSGRCQGGYCVPKLINILSKELNINIDDVSKNSTGSNIIMDCKTK